MTFVLKLRSGYSVAILSDKHISHRAEIFPPDLLWHQLASHSHIVTVRGPQVGIREKLHCVDSRLLISYIV